MIRVIQLATASFLSLYSLCTAAFTVTIDTRAPRTIYLQIGTGTMTSPDYNSGGTPVPNATINTVSVAVPVAAVGNSIAQAMSANAGATSSFYDGFAFCNSGQLYVGGFYRRGANNDGSSAAATLNANSSVPLTNGTGQSIPFTEIRWTSSGNSESSTTAQPFAAGTFNGAATQSIGTIARNQWAESCHTFSFANTAVRAGGIYTGTVTYTLTAP